MGIFFWFVFGRDRILKNKNPDIAQTLLVLALSIPIMLCTQCRNTTKAVSEDLISNEREDQLLGGKSEVQFKQLFTAGRRIPLSSRNGFRLGPMPSIGAISQRGEFIILDNAGVRQIIVFDNTGNPKAKIGSQGTETGQYLFPDNMFYQRDLARFFVYDGDLLRVLEFDEDFNYVFKFDLPIYIEQLLITDDGRFFYYTSGTTGPQGIDRVVYEYDRNGHMRNKFLKMPKAFSPAAESKGGGIVFINGYIYAITPYEYTISKHDASGKTVRQAHVRSPHYTPIKKYTDSAVETDFNERQRYHSTWSHILQIIQIGENQLGVIFDEAGTSRKYLDIFDFDLKATSGGILLPEHLGGPHALYTLGEKLYMLEPLIDEKPDYSGDLCIAEYVLILR
jgi:hypothetical protein